MKTVGILLFDGVELATFADAVALFCADDDLNDWQVTAAVPSVADRAIQPACHLPWRLSTSTSGDY